MKIDPLIEGAPAIPVIILNLPAVVMTGGKTMKWITM